MENKSRSKLHEAKDQEISTVEVVTEIETDLEEEETEIADTETTEVPEEILVIDPRDVSTVAKKVILPRTVKNVNIYFKLFSKKTKRIQQQRQTKQR